jgi:hypothetical protein
LTHQRTPFHGVQAPPNESCMFLLPRLATTYGPKVDRIHRSLRLRILRRPSTEHLLFRLLVASRTILPKDSTLERENQLGRAFHSCLLAGESGSSCALTWSSADAEGGPLERWVMRSQKPEGTSAAHRQPYTRREPLRRPHLAAARYFAATSWCAQRTLLQPGAYVASAAVPRLVARSFAGCPTLGPSARPRVRRQRFELSTPSPRARGTPQQPPHTASPACSADRKAGRITFDMSGRHRLAGGCPLDGGVRRHLLLRDLLQETHQTVVGDG